MDVEKAYRLILEKLITWMRDLIRLLPNMLLAALILAVGIYLCKWIRKLARRFFARVFHSPTIANLTSSFVYIACLSIVFFIALNILQLDQAVTSILAGAGIIGLALAFAFQDIAANFISGIFISFRKPLRIGDIVQVKDYMGKVVEINIRDTILRTFQGQMVIIPNKEVLQNPIENFSLLGRRRIDLTVGVSYGDDLEKVKRVTLEAVRDLKQLAAEEETTLFFEEFSDSSINFSIRIWANTPEQITYLAIRSEAIIRIKKAYDENGITIPFPIRTLDFGIKGGEKLSEQELQVGRGNGLPR